MTKQNRRQETLARIDSTIADLQECTDLEKIAAIGQREHDWLFGNYAKSSAGTIISRDYMSAIDRAFPPSDGEELEAHECWQKVNGEFIKRHKVVRTLMPTKGEWDDRNNQTKQSTQAKIDRKLPLYPQPLIETARDLLDDDKWAVLAAGLILLTGRRPTEIAWCGKFSAHSE